jgi:hypothetical protein
MLKEILIMTTRKTIETALKVSAVTAFAAMMTACGSMPRGTFKVGDYRIGTTSSGNVTVSGNGNTVGVRSDGTLIGGANGSRVQLPGILNQNPTTPETFSIDQNQSNGWSALSGQITVKPQKSMYQPAKIDAKADIAQQITPALAQTLLQCKNDRSAKFNPACQTAGTPQWVSFANGAIQAAMKCSAPAVVYNTVAGTGERVPLAVSRCTEWHPYDYSINGKRYTFN